MKHSLKRAAALITLLCMSLVLPVSADGGLMAKASLNLETNQLIVTGTVASAKGYVPMILQIKQGDSIVEVRQTVSGASENGTVSFSFPGLYIPADSPNFSYDIYVSADYVNLDKSFSFDYIGAVGRLTALQAVNSGISANGEAMLIEALGTNLNALGIDVEGYEALSGDAKTLLAKRIKGFGSYSLPQKATTADEIALVTSAAKSFATNYNESFMLAEASDISSLAALTKFKNSYAESYGLFNEDSETAYSEKKMAQFFKEAESFDALAAKVAAAAKASADKKAFKDAMLRAGILTLLEEGRYTKLQEMVEAMPELFVGIDDDYDRVKQNDRPGLYQKLTGGNYATIDAFVEAFNNEVKNTLSGSAGSSTNRGNSSGGGGGSKTKSETVVGANVLQTTGGTEGFGDLSEYGWATEAIYALVEQGVVAGRDAQTFDPGAKVTRAEFVKMLVGALHLAETDYDGRFADVHVDNWFAPYVAAAAAAGIAEGSDGYFMPNASITREDMAVLLFRALKLEAAHDERAVFYDSDSISSYAADAIYTLYQKGILSGVGDGYFAPLKPATRAEAAQIIYRAFK